MRLDPATVRLVIAARVVAFEDQGSEALRKLDQASEAFADQVPWDSEPEREKASLSVTQKAFALLWRDMGPSSPFIREARAVLLAELSKDQQREAIAWIQASHPMTTREILNATADA